MTVPRPLADPPQMPAINVAAGMTVTAILALLVAMGEVSRLSGEILDKTGRSWDFETLMGPGRLLDPFTEGWSSVFPSDGDDRSWWLIGYVLLDAAFIWLYGWVVAGWLSSTCPVLCLLLRVLAVFDVAEDVLALMAGTFAAPAPAALGDVVGAFSTLKWILTLVVVVLLLRRASTPEVRVTIKIWRVAFYHHRFSLLVVLPVAVLSIPGGSDLLDQLPDVQRRWLRDWQGARHAASAAVVVVIVTLGLFLLGRLRSGALWQRTDASVMTEQKSSLRLGLIGPAVVLVGVLWLWVRGHGSPWQLPGLNRGSTTVFVGVPLIIIGVSRFIRWGLAATGQPDGTAVWVRPKFHSVPTDEEKRAIVLAGDIVAVSALVVGGLGLVRSFSSIVTLGSVGLLAWSWLGAIAFAAGMVVSVLAWKWCASIFAAVTDEAPAPDPTDAQAVLAWYHGLSLWQRIQAVFTPSSPTPPRIRVRLGVLSTGIVLFFWVGATPEGFGATVGVIGTSLLALLAASLVIGGSVVAIQDRLAPELLWFKPIRTSSLPITTLLLVVLAWTSGMNNSVDVHGVRGLTSTMTPSLDPTTRPTVSEAIVDWDVATAGCGHVVTAGNQQYRLRPMFLIAAEGGGIRAAYWTAASLDLLRGVAAPDHAGTINWASGTPENPCARALFGGGASGGAVGLTVSRFAGASSARDRVASMAGPDALGAATSGLFVRDTTYQATGVPFFGQPSNTVSKTTDQPWLDRGGLIEKSWESTSGLDVPFLPADTHSAGRSVTGALVLNSTRVADGCRVWVSQLKFSDSPDGDCDSSTTPSGHTIDLFGAFANAAPNRKLHADDQCLEPITAATGALLASRFPFVTPSGVMGPCNGHLKQQLVDGGYVENSGLATILDLAPTWLQDVQKRNTAALSSTNTIKDLIVPVVMYLDNGTGGDLVHSPPALTSELFVPSTTTNRAKTALIDTPALLRDVERIIVTPSLFDAGAGVRLDVVKAINLWRKEPVVVVSQSTFPAVTAPLGWVLSEPSIETMDRALALQSGGFNKAGAVEPGAVEAVSSRGSLADALRLVTPDH